MHIEVDISFCKKVYPKLKRCNNTILLEYWNNNRIEKNILGSRLQFIETYPNFNLSAYVKYNKGLQSVGINTEETLMCHYWHFGNNEGRICNEVKDNCTLMDIIENYKINHYYCSVDTKNLNIPCNLSPRIKPGLPIIAFNINADDIKYIDTHMDNIYIAYTNYVDMCENLIKFVKTPNVMMIFCRDNKMKVQLDKLGIESIQMEDIFIDKYIYSATTQDTQLNSVLSLIPSTKILTNIEPHEIYSKCCVIIDRGNNIKQNIENNGISIINEWVDRNDLLTKLINTYDGTFTEQCVKLSDSDRILINIKLNTEFFKDYNKILFVCNADNYESLTDTNIIVNYLRNIYSRDIHIVFYHSGNYVGYTGTTVHITRTDKLRTSLRYINNHNKFDLVVIKEHSFVNIKEIFNCPIFYIISNTDSSKHISRNVINCMKISNRVFAPEINMVKYADRLNIPSTVFYPEFMNIPHDLSVVNYNDTEYINKSEVSVVETNKSMIPLLTDECEYNYEIFRNYIFTSKTICVLNDWDYNLDTNQLDTLQKIIDYYKLLDINVIYILFTECTQFLHNSLSNIKFVDYSNEDDLEFVCTKVICHNIDTLIVNSDRVNYYKYVDNIKKSSRRIINMNTVDASEILSNMSGEKLKVFINFAAEDVAYGGGNIFVRNMVNHLNKFENIKYTFTLDSDIDIYFLVDIRKDGRFKKFTFDEIYANKVKYGGRIIYRVNDCDVTRSEKSLEPAILKYVHNIDHYVFNSEFIKDYYFDKYDEFENKKFSIIYNTSNKDIFYAKEKNLGKKIRIATHHWSDNINKGYDYYYKLYKLEETRSDIEMVFIGRKFNGNYKDHPKIHGPLKGVALADALRGCDMYITASIYDACPMHVLEGLCCGLPMLYINHDGGGKNICEFSNNKIGESFSNFDELIDGIDKIKENYNMYRQNIAENMEMYGSDVCYEKFIKVFINNHYNIE